VESFHANKKQPVDARVIWRLLVAKPFKDYTHRVKMILLILGWHLILIGVLTIVIGLYCDVTSTVILGVGSFIAGLILAILFRKVPPSYLSDRETRPNPDRPLDYY
jgi:hypothetical protein